MNHVDTDWAHIEWINVHHTHLKRIKQLFKERYNLIELYMMYRGIIPYNQLRDITKKTKRHERI